MSNILSPWPVVQNGAKDIEYGTFNFCSGRSATNLLSTEYWSGHGSCRQSISNKQGHDS